MHDGDQPKLERDENVEESDDVLRLSDTFDVLVNGLKAGCAYFRSEIALRSCTLNRDEATGIVTEIQPLAPRFYNAAE